MESQIFGLQGDSGSGQLRARLTYPKSDWQEEGQGRCKGLEQDQPDTQDPWSSEASKPLPYRRIPVSKRTTRIPPGTGQPNLIQWPIIRKPFPNLRSGLLWGW